MRYPNQDRREFDKRYPGLQSLMEEDGYILYSGTSGYIRVAHYCDDSWKAPSEGRVCICCKLLNPEKLAIIAKLMNL